MQSRNSMRRSTLFRAHHTDLGQEVNALRLFHVTRILRMGGAWLSAVPLLLALLLAISPGIVRAADQPLRLQDLIDECLKNSPELRAFESRVEAAKYRIPQAKSLP